MTMSSTCKRRNVVLCNKREEDRISRLPDEIILHILTFLEVKDAVRTGILSKRFSFLWTNVSTLHFEQPVMDFVLTTLLFHKLCSLQKLSIVHDCRGEQDRSDCEKKLNRIIRLLSLSNVEDFTLIYYWYCILPQYFYSNTSLKKLRLGYCIFKCECINWKSLQSLCMDFIDLPESCINDILSGCPSLEFLELADCSTFTRIDLTNHKCLRELVIDGFYYEGCEYGKTRDSLEIIAPNLHYLTLRGDTDWDECKVLNAESLIDCCLTFRCLLEKHEAMMMLTSLLDDLSHVEVVTIGQWILHVLSSIQLNGLACPLSKSITCLEVETDMITVDMARIVCLLRGLSCLEKLFINERLQLNDSGRRWDLTEDEECLQNKNHLVSEIINTGFDLKLKIVGIGGLEVNQDLLCNKNEELLLVEFVMKNARCMKNMTIGACGPKHFLPELTKKILNFPRSSAPVIKVFELERSWRWKKRMSHYNLSV